MTSRPLGPILRPLRTSVSSKLSCTSARSLDESDLRILFDAIERDLATVGGDIEVSSMVLVKCGRCPSRGRIGDQICNETSGLRGLTTHFAADSRKHKPRFDEEIDCDVRHNAGSQAALGGEVNDSQRAAQGTCG